MTNYDFGYCNQNMCIVSVSNKDETHVNELLLLLVCQVLQAVVASGQVSLQAGQGRHHHPLHLTALRPGAGGGEAQPADTAPSADTGRQDVFVVKHAIGYLEVGERGEKEK